MFAISLATPTKLTGEDDVPSLFDMFYRVANEQGPKISGAGLGLYICQRIVSLHAREIGATIDMAADFVVKFRLPIINNERATV